MLILIADPKFQGKISSTRYNFCYPEEILTLGSTCLVGTVSRKATTEITTKNIDITMEQYIKILEDSVKVAFPPSNEPPFTASHKMYNQTANAKKLLEMAENFSN